MFTYHSRQTLLYNLFDIAQARKAPIAVLGCTGKVDVVEMLEKRVKSRFSHRHVFLPPARSIPAYWEMCKQGLVVEGDDARGEGLDADLEGFDEFMEYWSKKIDVSHHPACCEVASAMSPANEPPASLQTGHLPAPSQRPLLHHQIPQRPPNKLHPPPLHPHPHKPHPPDPPSPLPTPPLSPAL